jgi:hypothetical protein
MIKSFRFLPGRNQVRRGGGRREEWRDTVKAANEAWRDPDRENGRVLSADRISWE